MDDVAEGMAVVRMKRETPGTDTWRTDEMLVVCPRAAGLDVHKMCITGAVRPCQPAGGLARTAVREFSALPDGLRAMTDWLGIHGVTAAVMEGTGVYWKAPFEALEEAGIDADLLHAQHVKQIRGTDVNDVNDSLWLAASASSASPCPATFPPRLFRQLRQLTPYRRRLVSERSRARNRVHKTLDHDGLRLAASCRISSASTGGGCSTGWLVAKRWPQCILAGLTGHVRTKLAPLAKALAATLDPLALYALQIQVEAVDRADAALAAVDTRYSGRTGPIRSRCRSCGTPARRLPPAAQGPRSAAGTTAMPSRSR